MAKNNFLLKLVLSAIAGFLTAAVLVIISNYAWLSIPNVQWPLVRAYCGVDERFNGHRPKLAEDLIEKATYLSYAQMVIDGWPFIYAASCLGPCVLIITRLRRKSET